MQLPIYTTLLIKLQEKLLDYLRRRRLLCHVKYVTGSTFVKIRVSWTFQHLSSSHTVLLHLFLLGLGLHTCVIVLHYLLKMFYACFCWLCRLTTFCIISYKFVSFVSVCDPYTCSFFKYHLIQCFWRFTIPVVVMTLWKPSKIKYLKFLCLDSDQNLLITAALIGLLCYIKLVEENLNVLLWNTEEMLIDHM